MRRLRTLLLLVAACLALAACSLAKLGYQNLPTLATWEIDKWVDLDDMQREIVARRLDGLHRWHRHAQLPEYVGFLREVDDRVRTPLDAAQVARWRERVGVAWADLAQRAAPGLAELAATLRPEQIEQIRGRFAESNEKYREKFLAKDPAERLAARGDRAIKRAEFFLGKLSAEQARQLRAMVAAMPASEELWRAEREARQQRFIELLVRVRNERPSADAASAMVRDHLLTMWQSQDPQRREQLARAAQASDTLTASIAAIANARQREHFSKLVRGYAADFEDLSGRMRTAGR